MQRFRKAANRDRNQNRARRAGRVPGVEGLEARLALSTASQSLPPQAIGFIEGQAIDALSGVGIGGVKVQLIGADGRVAASTRTLPTSGEYVLPVTQSGPYVVREVTPRLYTQLVPTFASTPPTGSFFGKYGNSSWNYTSTNLDPTQGPVGPAGWANVAPAGAEPFESPIDIKTPSKNLAGVLGINFNPAVPKQTVNNSHQIQVQFTKTGADTVTAGGQSFGLTQFHFHDPAETTLHGRRRAMEEHFVLTNAAGGETVISVFLNVGRFNPSLQPVLNTASQALNAPNTAVAGPTTPIDFSGLLPTNRDGSLALQGWFYTGSLTTPPLSQPVNWFVLQKPIELSAAQLQQYETVAAGSGFLPNARPIQPLDGRRLNEVDYDVNFQVTSVPNLNFVLAPRVPSIF